MVDKSVQEVSLYIVYAPPVLHRTEYGNFKRTLDFSDTMLSDYRARFGILIEGSI